MTAAGIDRNAATQVDAARGDERARLSLLAEPPVLQLEQHGDRETVVDLGDVDVVGAEARPAVQRPGDRPGGQFGERLPHQGRELDAGLGAGNSALGDGTDEDGRPPAVARPRGAGHDDGAGPVGLQAEVEQPQRIGDHPGRQVVVHGEGARVQLRRGVGVRPRPAGERDMAEVLCPGTVFDHVTPGQESEDLAGGEKPVGREELVVAARAAHHGASRGGQAEPTPGAAVDLAEDQDRGRLAGQDGADRLAHHGAGGHPTRPDLGPVREVVDAEGVGEVAVQHGVHVAADDAVDVSG